MRSSYPDLAACVYKSYSYMNYIYNMNTMRSSYPDLAAEDTSTRSRGSESRLLSSWCPLGGTVPPPRSCRCWLLWCAACALGPEAAR